MVPVINVQSLGKSSEVMVIKVGSLNNSISRIWESGRKAQC